MSRADFTDILRRAEGFAIICIYFFVSSEAKKKKKKKCLDLERRVGGGINQKRNTYPVGSHTPDRDKRQELERRVQGKKREEEEGKDLTVSLPATRFKLIIQRNNEERLDTFDPGADRLPLRGNGKFFWELKNGVRTLQL